MARLATRVWNPPAAGGATGTVGTGWPAATGTSTATTVAGGAMDGAAGVAEPGIAEHGNAGPGIAVGGVVPGADGGAMYGAHDRRWPRAVLVHGITSSSNTWWRVGPALAARGWQVVGVDLRGHGASPRGTPGLALADLAADLAETIQSTPVDLLVGHSLGALVAMALLAADPGFARRVVLEDPPNAESFNGPKMAADIERDARWVRRSPAIFRAVLMAPPDRLRAPDADAKVANLLALDVDSVAAALRAGVSFDVVALARAVKVPALLFLGEERLGSALAGASRAQVATGLERGWTEVVPCGHSIHRDAFDAYMRRLDAWLDRVGVRQAPASP